MRILYPLLLAAVAAGQTWAPQTSGTIASLRGVSAVDAHVVWASGTGGTYLQTIDGGATWQAHTVPGADALDFRDVHAVDARTAYLLSSGTGDKARIYKTTDGGASWKLQLTSPDPKGFFDALAFWDANHGIAVGDPVDGQITIFTTDDGGTHWVRRAMPPTLPNEGAFAASGTCLITGGKREAWLGTGGTGAVRVYHTPDRGRSWTVVSAPLRSDNASSGIFSLAFYDAKRGIAAGGDYSKAADTTGNIAVTVDGGRTWSVPAGPPPSGFRSAVAWVADRKMWIAAGPSGSDVSTDNGTSWKKFDDGNYNAVAFVSSQAGWAVGPRGRVAKFSIPSPPAAPSESQKH